MENSCPRCGSHKVGRSRPHGAMDLALGHWYMRPHRCQQCMHRFFRFCSPHARQALNAAMLLVPAMVLGAWFTGLHSLARARELPTPVQQERQKPVDEVVRGRLQELQQQN